MDRPRDARAHAGRTARAGPDARSRPFGAPRPGPRSDGGQAHPAEPALHRARGAAGGLAPAAARRGAGGDLPLPPLVGEPPRPARAGAQDEEDDDENEQQLAESEVHRPVTLARPLIWGHRGASFEAPENTLAAFRLAREQGADGVELDAQRCASGEIVVMHDESLAR